MQPPPAVTGDANPRGKSIYRHWLTRSWGDGRVALVIGINPNTATDWEDDGMTNFLTSLLRQLDGDFQCGSYILVNCCDYRHNKPSELKNVDAPCSPTNLQTVERNIAKCDFIVASWGTTNYGKVVEDARAAIANLVKGSAKPVICFSPKGRPIHCSRTSANSPDGRWSKTPIPLVW